MLHHKRSAFKKRLNPVQNYCCSLGTIGSLSRSENPDWQIESHLKYFLTKRLFIIASHVKLSMSALKKKKYFTLSLSQTIDLCGYAATS